MDVRNDLKLIRLKVNQSQHCHSDQHNADNTKSTNMENRDLRLPSVVVLFLFNNICGFLAYHYAGIVIICCVNICLNRIKGLKTNHC